MIHHRLDQGRLNEALDALALIDRDVARGLARIGYPAARIRAHGFTTLLQTIVSQQLSTKAATAIWRKLEATLGDTPLTPASFLTLDESVLRGCGFSGRKVEYGRGLASAIVGGSLDPALLAEVTDEVAIEIIAALRGFGRWSAEIYLLFALGRVDVFPADDLGLQLGFMRLKRLSARPKTKELRELVQSWSPFRGAGALFLWHYYGVATLDVDGAALPPTL